MNWLIKAFLVILICGYSPIFGQNAPQTYRIVAISQNDSSIQSVSNEIQIYFPLAIQIPNAFTPNGDGLNDQFNVVSEGVESFRLIIFNRWGNIIFRSEDISHSWDGTFQGQPVPLGTYNFEIFAKGKEFGQIHKAGQVMVAN